MFSKSSLKYGAKLTDNGLNFEKLRLRREIEGFYDH